MKEICIDVRMAFNSGIGTYVRNIVSLLKSGPFNIKLIATAEIIKKWPALASFDLILTSAPLYSIQEQIQFPFLVPSCDLFWTPHYNIPLFPIRAKKRITTIHDVYHLAYGKILSLPKRLYAKAVIKGAATISDHIITDSTFSKEEIIKYTNTSQNKITVISLGVDKGLFSAKAEPVLLEQIRAKYQLPDRYFLFVSTLAPHKNVDRLLRAWNILAKNYPDWKLVLVGKHVKNQSWQSVIDQNSLLQQQVMFLQQVDNEDLPILYQLAYGAIHPSLYEGFGLPPLEAMSSGCPVVVSKIASLPEVCGDSAVYVDPYDAADMAAGMQKMIEDQSLYHELKAKGLQRSANFTWEKTAAKHIEILEKFA